MIHLGRSKQTQKPSIMDLSSQPGSVFPLHFSALQSKSGVDLFRWAGVGFIVIDIKYNCFSFLYWLPFFRIFSSLPQAFINSLVYARILLFAGDEKQKREKSKENYNLMGR